ncbi:MAG: aldehyde ferredoxin oxidoreductase C-terminal domain-containing protein [Syntrophothermus sp.]
MQIAKNEARCTGCRTCEVLCSLVRYGENNPKKAAIRIAGQFPVPGHYRIQVCDQCGDCARACPVEAIQEKDGVYLIDEATCTGCGICVETCRKGAIFTHAEEPVPIKCTACGECIEFCPRQAIYDADAGAEKMKGAQDSGGQRAGLAYLGDRKKLYGYAGQMLRVNLSTGSYRVEPLPEALAQDYIGGRGIAAKLLYDELPRGIDPLGPENKVVIASGPLAGVFLPAGGKVTIAAKSPATGGYGDSNMGGHLAAEMKYAGYDVIIIEGKAARPSYLFIQDDRVEIRDAAHYWGKGALEVEKMLKDHLGEEFQIATIGPAGEKLVKFACVSHDFGRQAGRTGTGAVLGSKLLKAVAVSGKKEISLADKEGVLTKGKEMFRRCFANPALKEWQDYGTAGVTTWVNEIGAFPTRNFQSEFYAENQALAGTVMREKLVVNDKACFGCPMACGKYSHTRTSKYDAYVEGPEYETTALIGGNCAMPSIEDVAYGNYICDELGLDTISAGNVIGFAMECFQKGIITTRQTGGKEIRFGDIESFKFLAEKIAAREGIGDLLADGVKAAAARLGGDSQRFAIQIKGLEWSGYGARNAPAMMLAYMTCDVGAHHNRAWAITHDVAVGREKIEGKAGRVIELQHIRPMFDILGACRLLWVEIGLELEHYPEILRAVTGLEYNLAGLLKISERVWNLTRAFWAREIQGFGRAYDYPPARFYEDPVPDGPSAGKFIAREGLDRLLDEYYKLRGWDKDGLPTREKLHELGLDFVRW